MLNAIQQFFKQSEIFVSLCKIDSFASDSTDLTQH